MKKLIMLLPATLLFGCATTTEVVDYRQVTVVAPPTETITIVEPPMVDVTTTTVEYY